MISLINKPEFWRASSSPRQSGLLGRSQGASGRCRSAPGMLLDALRAAPAAPSEHSLAKEAQRYATFCKKCCILPPKRHSRALLGAVDVRLRPRFCLFDAACSRTLQRLLGHTFRTGFLVPLTKTWFILFCNIITPFRQKRCPKHSGDR